MFEIDGLYFNKPYTYLEWDEYSHAFIVFAGKWYFE